MIHFCCLFNALKIRFKAPFESILGIKDKKRLQTLSKKKIPTEKHNGIVIVLPRNGIIYKLFPNLIYKSVPKILTDYFHNTPSRYHVYICSTFADFDKIIMNDIVRYLWIFGDGKKNGINIGNKFYQYSLFKDEEYVSHKKGMIYQFHCNAGSGESLTDILLDHNREYESEYSYIKPKCNGIIRKNAIFNSVKGILFNDFTKCHVGIWKRERVIESNKMDNDSLNYIYDTVSDELDRENIRTTNLDKKAATLIAATGVIFGLELTILNERTILIENGYMAILFITQLFVLLISLYYAYSAHQIQLFTVGDMNYIIKKYNFETRPDNESIRSNYPSLKSLGIYYKKSSVSSSKIVNDRKANKITWCQHTLFLAIVLLLVLIIFIILARV